MHLRLYGQYGVLCCIYALIAPGSGLHDMFPAEHGGPVTGRVRFLGLGLTDYLTR